MGAAKANAIAAVAPPEPDDDWSSLANSAVTALLDHVAGELAREYVRLVENAAEAGEAEDPHFAYKNGEV